MTDLAPLGYVFEAVRPIRAALDRATPLIGFAGAPFTLACYAIEGGGSRHYEQAKTFMYRDPGAWDALMERLVDATSAYLNGPGRGRRAGRCRSSIAGWATSAPTITGGSCSRTCAGCSAGLPADVPVIHFGTDTGSLLELQRDAGGHVIGLDWRVDLAEAWERLGPGVGVQGNLDPVALLRADPGDLERQTRRILDQAAGRPGHIFNLGHGILPQTPVDHVLAVVDMVRSHRREGPRAPRSADSPA